MTWSSSVTSYRLYCQTCQGETVLRERDLESTDWKVLNLHHHEGVCPVCNPAVDVEELDEEYEEYLELESLDNVGETAAENLRGAGLGTAEGVRGATDAEILDVSWVGEKVLAALREAASEE